MAIAVTTDLVDVNLSEVTTNYAVLGTFATAIAASPDTWIQSANTVGGRVSAATAWAHASLAATDLSTGEKHIFQWLKCISVPALDTIANGGLAITMSSDATPTLVGVSPNDGPSNSKSWWVGGSASALSGWICYVVDPNSTPSPGVVNGTPVVTGIQRIGIRSKVLTTVGGGAVKPVNIVFDATRYGTGLTYTGDNAGTPGAFADILTTAMSNANAWGILTADSSINFGAGKFDFGTTAQAATSSFKSVGDLFVWRNFQVANTFYAWRIRGAAGFVTTFQIGNFTASLVSGGSVVKGAGDPASTTHATWTFDAGTNTTVNLYGAILSELRRTTLQSTSTLRGCSIKNFGDITANGALIDSCTFQDIKTTAPISAVYAVQVLTTVATLTNCKFINCATAVLWNVNADTNTKLDNTAFTSGGTGFAIELGANTPATITLSGVTFTGYGASGTTNAAIFNNSGKAITINIIGGGTTPTINNGAGASTTVNNSVTLTVTVTDSLTGAAIQFARVAIYKTGSILAGQELMNALTNASGVATATFAFVSNQAIVIRARAGSPLLATPVNAAFSTASTGGSLVAGTYWYRVTATDDIGETLASVETSQVVPAGTSTNTVTVNWATVTGAKQYKVYGRSTGAELFIASVGAVLTYTDLGSITPAGALPSANTTGTTRYFPIDATGTITSSGFTSTYTLTTDIIASAIPL